jgi:hypothetical protein
MLGVFAANHHHHAIPADDLAVLATRLDRRSYLHLSTAFQNFIPMAATVERCEIHLPLAISPSLQAKQCRISPRRWAIWLGAGMPS